MKRPIFSVMVGAVMVLVMGAGLAGAAPLGAPPFPASVDAVVTNGISYQGRLTSPGGAPLSGTYTMRFIVYDQPTAGTALWDSGNLSIGADGGLFQATLGVDHADFNGRALWLSLIISGEVLSPRQEIGPAPYALSLRPGADVVGDSTLAAGDATVAGYAPATGTAVYADAHNGAGLFGDSEGSYGVWGSSDNSWGGYFTSSGGYGIRVGSTGAAHYDHGAYVTSVGGYGVYAQSSQNMGVRGEAGDVTGITQPTGPVGVAGIGANRGVFGSSNSGGGVYGYSSSNYGAWGQSTTYRGVTGRTSRTDNNYGLYTPDNLYSLNYTLAGTITQVMQNSGPDPLSPGDVVVFSGIDRMVDAVGGPIVQVRRASAANSTGVAGIVASRFNLDAVDPALESPDGGPVAGEADGKALTEVTPAGDAAPGETILVVVQGPALVNATALAPGSIQPGDLLSTGSIAGSAGAAPTVLMGAVETTVPGTVFAKALEAADGEHEMIYVYVTLQ